MPELHALPLRGARSVLAAAVTLLLLAGTPAAASNLNFLGKAPISRFNEQDLDLLRGALGRALASEEMGVTFNWSNPKTGAGGELTPIKKLEKNGLPCREVRAVSRHPQTAPADNVFLLCQKDGRWRVAPR